MSNVIKNIQQKRFEKLEDFNLIYINNFEKLNLPRLIAGNFLKKYPEKISVRNFLFFKKMVDNTELPLEVLDSFNSGNNTVSYDGIVYKRAVDYETGEVSYDSYSDATGRIHKILNLPEIKTSVEDIIGSIRRPALSRDLLSLPGFRLIEDENLGDISLSLKDDVALETTAPMAKNTRSCKLVLSVIKDSLLISLDLGILTYSVYRKN